MIAQHTVTTDIQKMLAHLRRRYDVVGADTLIKRKKKVRIMQYNLLNPVVTMYAKFEELKQLGISTANLYSTAQIITFALHIIHNTHDFE